MVTPVPELIGLFPTPLMRVEKLLDRSLVRKLVAHFRACAQVANSKSHSLFHTEIFQPEGHDTFAAVAQLIQPHLEEFGEHLFGEHLHWHIKEMWVNVLESGGRQAMHNHANSFVSGVIYLTRSHPSASTVFLKSPAGSDFIFNNNHSAARIGPFNAGKFVVPTVSPGDMILFPSYLLHEVPRNDGPQRISLAFNAIPERLDSWGYSIRFAR